MTRILNEGLDIAEPHRARCHTKATYEGDEHIVDVAHKHHGGLNGTRHELRTKTGFKQLLIGDGKTFFHFSLFAKGFDDGVAGKGLFNESVQCTCMRPLRDESLLRPISDLLHGQHRKRHGHNGNERQ